MSMKSLCFIMVALVVFVAGLGAVAAVDPGERVEIMFGRGNPVDTGPEAANPVPIDPWQAPDGGFEIKRTTAGFTVRTPAAKMEFSNRTCSISRSWVLGTPLGSIAYPNLTAKVDGTVYSQNNSRYGSLEAVEAGDFQIIKGTFNLTSDDGKVAFPWSVEYKICKQNGYILVTYTDPSPTGTAHAKGSYFSIDHEFDNADRHCLNELALGCSLYNPKTQAWIGWENKFMSDKEEVYADKHLLNAVLFANGRIGVASEPPTLNKVFDIASQQSGYLKVSSSPGVRRFSWILVNYPDDVRPFPASVCYALAYYPPREYRRPKMHFFSCWVSGRQMALLGSDLTENLDSNGFRKREDIEDIHGYGGKDLLMAPNWAGAAAPDYKNAREGQQFLYSVPFTYAPSEDAMQLCWRSASFIREFYHYLMTDVVRDWNLDGARLDCNTPTWCNNTAHGCDAGHTFYGPDMFEQMRLLRKRYDDLSKANGKTYMIGAAHNLYPSVNAYLDFSVAGEGNSDYPSDVVADLYFNSLLYGRDFALLAGGNSPINVSDPRIYEQMLERCGTVLAVHFAWGNVDHNVIAAWKKYQNPLYIFDVEKSEVHHPFHYDYIDFAGERSSNILNVIYSRPGRALVTLCNRSAAQIGGTIKLNLKKLAIKGGNALLYDVRSNTTTKAAVADDGWLRVNVRYPRVRDASFIQISSLPKIPSVIWHSVTTRSASGKWHNRTLTVDARGAHDLSSRLYVYCPEGWVPSSVKGGTLRCFIPAERLCMVDFDYGTAGSQKIFITFKEVAAPAASIEELKRMRVTFDEVMAKLKDSNFTRSDLRLMNSSFARMRTLASAIGDADERYQLLEDINDAENLVFSFDEIVNSKERCSGAPTYWSLHVQEAADYVRTSGAKEMEWAVIGPFKSEGMDKTYPCEGKIDYSASYTGKDGKVLKWHKVRGYYLGFYRVAERLRLDAGGGPRKDMVCFAHTIFDSPEDREGVLVFRIDGAAKVWLNGQEIASSESFCDHMNSIPPENRVPIKIRKGRNELLVKTQSAGEQWSFFPVIKDAQGKTMEDIRMTTDAPVIGSVYAHDLYINV